MRWRICITFVAHQFLAVLKFTIILLTTCFLGSCAFNKSFYNPDSSAVNTPPDARSVYIKYAEHDSIHTLFYAPTHPKASLFILHGGSGNLSGWSEVADLFYQDGYAVFIMDYPGFGNSSGAATHKSVMASTQAAVNHFITLPQVQNTKKLIMGFSLGGNLALKVAAENEAFFDAMLIEGAYTSQKALKAHQTPRPFKGFSRLLTKTEIDGEAFISKWTKPLLIVHSSNDAISPYKMAKSLYDSAIRTKQKELWTISGPHLAGLGSNFELYMAKISALLTLN